ncbi:MAG: SusC/RagA family TonB-linked outer membrane protein [Bacteroidetes bacterium]|nr:SusC/RagA family TonB-linked outer membrane protein [Bacteroidota bacterium]
MVFVFLFLGLLTQAQTRVVTGTVKDASTKEPLFGVAIGVKNTSLSAFTNVDGQFTIALPDSVKKISLRLFGYKPKEYAVADNIDAVMTQEALQLDETVVTANAIKREKRSLGYSTQQVSNDELTKGQSTNIISGLQGKVSGVNVTSSTGGPGTSNRIVIRGGTSLTGNNQALMVVDGIPIDNSAFRTGDDLNNQVDYGNRANDINPDDIESISVLKGPAAAALYGSRASNGAIIITTKHGRNMTNENRKMDITFSSSTTFSRILRVPRTQGEYGEGDLHNIADDRRENFSWGKAFDGEYRPWGQIIDGQQRVKKYENLPNNIKDFFTTGYTYNNNLAISGGNEKSTYYLSMNALNNKGIIKTTDYNKYSIRFNGTTQLTNKFTSSISASYNSINSDLPTGGQSDGSIYANLIQTPRDIPITEGKDLNNPFNQYNDQTGKYGFYGAYTTDPYFVLQNYRNSNKVDHLQGNTTLSYAATKWLTITERIGGDIYSDRRYQKWKKYSYEPIDPFWAGNNKIYQGKYSEDIYNVNEITNDLMLNFDKQINSNWRVYGTLGHNVRQKTTTELFAQTNAQGGLAIADYYNISNSNGAALTTNNTFKRRLIGAYMDANVAYKNMLFLGVTARNDWSSTLPKSNRSYFYPSVNASWVFSELFNDSLKNSWFNYGKLRASYAKVGKDADEYLTTSIFNKTTIDGGFGTTTTPFGTVNAFTQGDRLGNPNLKPEITTAFEIGTELSFFHDRLGFDFSYYVNNSTNQIINVPISNASGFTSKTINAGKIENKGVELLVRGTPISRPNGLKVDVTATYTRNRNKVVSIQDGVDQIVLGGFSRMAVVAQQGQPYGAFYGVSLQTDGNGHTVVDSATGLPMTTTNSVILGNYQPKFQASLGAQISYKNFSFSFMFDTKQGGVFYSYTKSLMDFVGTAPETAEGGREDKLWDNSVYKNYKGEYVTNTNRKYDVYNYYTNKIPDGQHILNASYIKLREVSMSYRIPSKYLTKTPFGAISVGLFANNLFLWTHKTNVYSDPEMGSSGSGNVQGFEFAANPSQRNFGFKFNFNF